MSRKTRECQMSTVPRNFAITGIAIGTIASVSWWLVRIYNPFHLPTMAQAPPDYREPFLSAFVNYGVLALCPGVLLQALTLEMKGWISWLMWILAIILNAPIYYAVGCMVRWVTHPNPSSNP